MNIIALADKKWGIGNNGRLLVDIPEDKKLFRGETYGKVVVMGRKTYESLPNQSALEGRKNIADFDKLDGWKVTARSDEHTYFDLCYEFVRYQRV